jgi:DNA-binding FadR family transcriptional regulator
MPRRSQADSPSAMVRSPVSGKLPARVIHTLGRRIVAGRYPQGSVLPNEALLCGELGVSRTALREGVKVLVAKGLVLARPRVGTRVQPAEQWQLLDADVLAWRCELPPDDGFITQLVEMREIIEPAAAALAAKNRSEAQLAQIETAFERMARARTLAQWVAADFEFHRGLLHATGNALLVPLVALIGSALESVLSLAAERARDTVRDFKVALPEHERVLDAVRRRDTQAAHQRMAFLLSDTRRRLLPAEPLPPRKFKTVKTAKTEGAIRVSTRRHGAVDLYDEKL